MHVPKYRATGSLSDVHVWASCPYDARMTSEIRIMPTETPAERELADAFRLVDEVRTKRDRNESTREDMNAALARRKAAEEAVTREKAAKQSPKEQFREQEVEDYDLNNIDSPLFHDPS